MAVKYTTIRSIVFGASCHSGHLGHSVYLGHHVTQSLHSLFLYFQHNIRISRSASQTKYTIYRLYHKKLFLYVYRYAELNDEELSKRRRRKRSVNSSDDDNLQYLNRIHLGTDVQKKHKESCKKIMMTFIHTAYLLLY